MEQKGGWIRENISGLLISIAIAESVGVVSGFLTKDSMKTFEKLEKPFFSPPGWVFPVVWGILFLLMGVASYLVYNKRIKKPKVRIALAFYAIQLIFNFLWTILFFGLGLRGFAFLWILVLLALIIATTVKFSRVSKIAAYLMVPYIVWVIFAGVLNYAIWQLNR